MPPAYYAEYIERPEVEQPSPSIRIRFPAQMLLKIDEKAARSPAGLSRNEYIRHLCATHPEMLGGE